MRFRSTISMAILALTVAAAPALTAQTPSQSPPPRGPGRMQAAALQGITLTPAQQAKVDSITASYRAKMPQMTPGTPPSDADRQKAMGLMSASLKDVRTVLTPDQQPIFDKNVAAIQQQMQQRMQGGPPQGAAPQGAPPQGDPPKPY